MPLRSKSATSKANISVDDVIGRPVQTDGETKSAPMRKRSKPMDKNDSAPIVKKATEEKIRPEIVSKTSSTAGFVPGIISSPSTSFINNGPTVNTDRYSTTPTQSVSGYLDIM